MIEMDETKYKSSIKLLTANTPFKPVENATWMNVSFQLCVLKKFWLLNTWLLLRSPMRTTQIRETLRRAMSRNTKHKMYAHV